MWGRKVTFQVQKHYGIDIVEISKGSLEIMKVLNLKNSFSNHFRLDQFSADS